MKVVIDGLGAEITTGIKGEGSVSFRCLITGWTLLADQAGDIVIDIWKDVFANYPPTIVDTITGSELPTLSGADHDSSTTLAGWTTLVEAGDTFIFNVDSVSTVTRVELALSLQPI